MAKRRILLGQVMEKDCMGCAIANGSVEPPGGLLYESPSFVMHQDLETPIKGFLIIAPRAHIQSITELSRRQRIELMDLIHRGISALKELDITEEVTVIQEERSKHLHVWLFPWQPWMDGKFAKSFTSLREINTYAKSNRNYQKIGDIIDTALKVKSVLDAE